ncbi:hypothetical protein THSYN_06055 [Candidatus Thiodictyon syntrophicum]|jgi:hypothetical protein|uniref:Uncharacterized protein n=1 Tax=Candidatus Thiodictyon syntrophicum TaxID=1166950 RepID=A0A2K8U4S8_9GAMM|nr:hypothetical protein THSYN_06055 [Candidatus Thiodictyon syntrophicum]
MPSAFDNLCGPGKPLKSEPPDAKKFADAPDQPGERGAQAARLAGRGQLEALSGLCAGDTAAAVSPMCWPLCGPDQRALATVAISALASRRTAPDTGVTPLERL